MGWGVSGSISRYREDALDRLMFVVTGLQGGFGTETSQRNENGDSAADTTLLFNSYLAARRRREEKSKRVRLVTITMCVAKGVRHKPD